MSIEETQREFTELARMLKEAQTAFANGNFARSEQLFNQTLGACERFYGDDHSDTHICLQMLADTYFALRRHQDAIPLLRRLLTSKQKQEPANANIASILFKLSRTYEKVGQYAEAEAFYRITARMSEQLFGADSSFLANVLEGMLKVLRRTQKTKEADQIEERLVAMRGRLATGARDPSAMLHHLAETISPGMNAPQPGSRQTSSMPVQPAPHSPPSVVMPIMPIGDSLPPGLGPSLNALGSTIPPGTSAQTFFEPGPASDSIQTIRPGSGFSTEAYNPLTATSSNPFTTVPPEGQPPVYDTQGMRTADAISSTVPPSPTRMGSGSAQTIPPTGSVASRSNSSPPSSMSIPPGSKSIPPGSKSIPPGGKYSAPGAMSIPPGGNGRHGADVDAGVTIGQIGDTFAPGTMNVSKNTGEIHRPTSLRFKGDNPDGERLPSAGLNDSQRIAVILSLSLVGFIGFCILAMMALKISNPFSGGNPAQALSVLFPDGMNHGSIAPGAVASAPTAEQIKTPIYRSPDGYDQITITDGDHAMMQSRRGSFPASYVVSPPYITITPEGQATSYSFQKTEDSLIDQHQNVLYAIWAPEMTVINEMKVLSQIATKYYMRHHRYPSTAEQLQEMAIVISYTNPFTKQPMWPVKRTLLGMDDDNLEVNMNDLTSLKAAVEGLRVWKADETIDKGTVEFFHVPTGAGRDIFVIRGSDRTGHILRSSRPEFTDMIICVNGQVHE